MKTIEQALAYTFTAPGGSDRRTLALFVPEDQLKKLDFSVRVGQEGKHKPLAWTEEAVKEQLRDCVAFGFQMATEVDVVSAYDNLDAAMFLAWVLDVELDPAFKSPTGSGISGITAYKALAAHFGLPNPLGDDTGMEDKYRPSAGKLMSMLLGSAGFGGSGLAGLAEAMQAVADMPPTPGCACPACKTKLARLASEEKPTLH